MQGSDEVHAIPPRQSGSRLHAIALMVCGVTAFAVGDGIGKLLSRDQDVLQIVWSRFAFALPLLPVFAPPRRWPEMLRGRVGLQVIRALLPVAGSVFIVLALRTVPLADATAITFVAPLLVTALSIVLLGERIDWQRWTAIVLGFVGVIVVARPGADTFQWAALLPLGTALVYSVYQVMTRILSATADPGITLIFTVLVGAVVLTAALPFVWRTPSAEGWALMVASGLLSGFAHYTLIRAYAAAPASTVAPFNYIQIVGATVVGLVMFGAAPDAYTILGTAIIVASGLYLVARERRRAALTVET
jgi:drug/metabolite transporter (DMT)-like permease